MTVPNADLYDLYHRDIQVCSLPFRGYGLRKEFAGPCAVVRTHEDHLPVLRALERPGRGRVLVVDGGGSRRVGITGDRVADIALRNGWAGLVINGVIRDSLAIDRMEIGIKALGSTPRRGWVAFAGPQADRTAFGDVVFETGHWIYADADGVLVSPMQLDLAAAAGHAAGASEFSPKVAIPDFRVEHLHIWCADPAAAAEGYERLFGGRRTGEQTTANGLRITLSLAGVQLFIEQIPPGAAPNTLGLEHFALVTPQFDTVVEGLRTAGCRFLAEPRQGRPDARIAFVEAPGGGRIELIEAA